MTAGIYVIRNKIDNRLYIGQSNNILKRFREHKNALNGNYHFNRYLQRVWNKYGSYSFEFYTLETCNLDDLTDREQFWIDTLKPEFNLAPAANSMKGYKHTEEARMNMSLAHVGKSFHTEEHRKFLSEKMKGNKYAVGVNKSIQIEAMRKATKGKPKSDEHKAKISAAQKGRRLTEAHKTKLSVSAKRRWCREKELDWNLKISNL